MRTSGSSYFFAKLFFSEHLAFENSKQCINFNTERAKVVVVVVSSNKLRKIGLTGSIVFAVQKMFQSEFVNSKKVGQDPLPLTLWFFKNVSFKERFKPYFFVTK